jgi:nitrate reductase molybdenum cofactor assembly chaperone NarJ/NarW
MAIYKILARLLDYPTGELLEHLDEIEQAVATDTEVTAGEREAIQRIVAHLRGVDLYQLQSEYVQTFDVTPEHSLHLTHHLFGDDANRGPALIDLGEHYKGMGLQAVDGELPDYLPLILEYASTLDRIGAQMFLNEAVKVLEVLAANLEQAASPYAPLIRIIENRGRLARAAA